MPNRVMTQEANSMEFDTTTSSTGPRGQLQTIIDSAMEQSQARLYEYYGERGSSFHQDAIEIASSDLERLFEEDREFRKLPKRTRKIIVALSADMVATAALARSTNRSGDVDRSVMRVIVNFARFLLDGIVER